MSGPADRRIVVVTRKTPLELLVERHGTRGQAAFFLRGQGQDLEPYLVDQASQDVAVQVALSLVPANARRTRVARQELDRFVFEPGDIVLAIGQDGLVANVAKYLDGQVVVGINPAPERGQGVLCTFLAGQVGLAIAALTEARPRFPFPCEERAMVEVEREDGQLLRALNELFLGHRTHQSARYTLEAPEGNERHSSSGVIVSTGTGGTGWGRSIAAQRGLLAMLPGPLDPHLAWFAREPWPSATSGDELSVGVLEPGQCLRLVSEMGEGGVIFGDGIESDSVEFTSGQVATVRVSQRRLRLLVGPARRVSSESSGHT